MEFFFGIDLPTLIRTIGYIGIFAAVFAESGLLFGFFLPGDSLLFTAGFLASQGFFHIAILAALCFCAAVAGDSVGYAIGWRLGPKIFRRERSFLFHPEYIAKTKIFYGRYGGKAIILARFIPIIRTFAPIFAGVGNMRYPLFIFCNILGGFLWTLGLTFTGYTLGTIIPEVDRYLIPIIFVIILISMLPLIVHLLKERSRKK